MAQSANFWGSERQNLCWHPGALTPRSTNEWEFRPTKKTKTKPSRVSVVCVLYAKSVRKSEFASRLLTVHRAPYL